ncbi:hypothetical protein DES53_10237 [Roseimicrobium gellanilyticum]|uniref:Uncharacterized protein n=1 Tax=Roseimicrobium gellanilyticum TaxID=748857 RepID=A0A366HPR2_9BACT|nr:hypothetical protein [Roseimicrobium gellanilyticum]RBP45655.1 hypothetical protein DES53_10237 [Roseimicrobium gellanilyticum]
MARRAKSQFTPLHLIAVLAGFGLIAFIGFKVLQGTGASTGFADATDLDIREYMENSNALSNNTYRIEGTIADRLDNNWPSSRGRLFEVMVDDGPERGSVGVVVPAKFNGTNIQRGQRFKFKVTVQSGTGMLEVMDLTKA